MQLFRDWEIKKTLGSGSFGTVYEVENSDPLRVGERAAIKKIVIPKDENEIEVLRSDAYDDASITQTFQERLRDIVNEYRIMQQISGHTNIVNCRDIGYIQHDNGIGWDIYIVMELLTPLRKLPTERFTEEEIVRLGRDICKALSVCAKRGIIHRDVKPDNIFVSEYGDYKLGDFGISRVMEGTRASTIGIGTYDYMAPEVLRESYDRTADLYSLGMVLYWLLNERRTPFLKLPPAVPTASEKELARKRRFNGDPLPPPAHGSEELKRIVLKACAFDPKERYQSAEELLEDLEAVSTGKRSRNDVFSAGRKEQTSDRTDLSADATNVLRPPERAPAKAAPTFATVVHWEKADIEPEEETVSAFHRSTAESSTGSRTSKETAPADQAEHEKNDAELPFRAAGACENKASRQTLDEFIQKFKSNGGDLTPVYFPEDRFFLNKLEKAQKSYFAYSLDPDEQPLLLCDLSAFSNGNSGFVLTNKRFFAGNWLSQLCVANVDILSFFCKRYTLYIQFQRAGEVKAAKLYTFGWEKNASLLCDAMNEMMKIIS